MDESKIPENIILTIYYTKHIDPQRIIHQKNNNFLYIKKFYQSVVKNNMHAIIFHDNLTNEFVQKYANDNIMFMPIPLNIEKYGLTSMNDIRFMIYLDFLKNNFAKSIKKIIISDVADVEFNANIFDHITENKLYVCYDRNRTFNHYYLTNRIKLTYLSNNHFVKYMDKKALQAGLFAGNYDQIVQCLNHMKDEFNNIVDKNYNTNYIVYNHVVYDKMADDLVFSNNGIDIKAKCGKSYKYLSWKP